MSEAKNTLSKAHEAALIRTADAEAQKHLAEAGYFVSKARETEVSADYAELRFAGSSMDLEQKQYERDLWEASDTISRVYRFDEAVSAGTAQQCIRHLQTWARIDPAKPIELIFNSPGGSVTDGLALFDFIQTIRAGGTEVTTGTYGMAASMAGILLQAGDVRWMGEQSWLLIHRTAFGAVGKSFEVEDRVEWIKRIEKRVIDIFVKRSGGKMSARKLKSNWERKDFWVDADEALELGLIDEVRSQLL